MIRISERLKAAASLVGRGNILADIGTDHAYVPIYLVQKKKIPRAIAMDINRGPLERAKEHIAQYGMGDYIETRLSDGVAALSPGEADSILIAGMGGGLAIHILEAGETVCESARELVLQPQSELARVRFFLEKKGYVTEAEDMVKEDGKYYPMMRVRYESDEAMQAHYEQGRISAAANPLFYTYGRLLLEGKHPVLQEYLEREKRVYTDILCGLQKQPQTKKITDRVCEVEAILKQNGEALTYYR